MSLVKKDAEAMQCLRFCRNLSQSTQFSMCNVSGPCISSTKTL